MLYSHTELVEIVSTRIAHDIGGNIGALGSALELIAGNNNELDEDTLKIITAATSTLKARQRFLRIAFGLNSKATNADELKSICNDYLKTLGNPATPIELKINSISPDIAKLVFLSVMSAADVCMRGGQISIDLNKENMIINVKSNSKLIAAKIDVYRDIIDGKKPDEYISQYIQFIFLREILGVDVPMKLMSTENEMTLIIG
ncbi:MAG: hypothetical protein J6N49_06335 [Alphaproteobacteria bacterium]|nr:hypothetical protein [Alphaproteobacteria bacterium]